MIVCADGAPGPDLANSVSQVGRDPLWQSGTTQRWLRGDQLSSGTADGVTVVPPGVSGPVIAVPHQVSYDAVRGCWYSDIAIAQLAALSYAPLVQLCVARYQPESLEGRAISKIVQTSFVPLMPSRTLSWTQVDAQNISVTLEGISQAGPSRNVVEIALEQRPKGTGDWSGPTVMQADSAIPGWRAVPQATSGTLGAQLILPLPQGEFDRRIRVTEYEYPSPANQPGALAELQRRAVFTDLIELK